MFTTSAVHYIKVVAIQCTKPLGFGEEEDLMESTGNIRMGEEGRGLRDLECGGCWSESLTN